MSEKERISPNIITKQSELPTSRIIFTINPFSLGSVKAIHEKITYKPAVQQETPKTPLNS